MKTIETPESSQPGTPMLFFAAGMIVLLDQLLKYLCDAALSYNQPMTVFPGFDLLLVYNTGAAFSFLSDAGGWQRWLLTLISLVVSVVIAIWIVRLRPHEKLLGVALALVLGGAAGNLIDRVFLGYVIDFISLYYGEYRFATFNLADAAISIGAGLMALDLLFSREPSHE
ncbi:MAG: signal peptidase II [Pseudohongiellaceae bacterium]